jgi:hypothetical protein
MVDQVKLLLNAILRIWVKTQPCEMAWVNLGHRAPRFTECSFCHTRACEEITFQRRRKCGENCLDSEKPT